MAALASAPGAWASTPIQDITSAGPLTDVWIGNELGCQIAHAGDTELEFFPPNPGSPGGAPADAPGDCGTFLSIAGNLFGPDFANHPGFSSTPFSGLTSYAPFTPVAQSGVAGSGTAASPYQVTTAVSAGTSGLGIVEVDSYVIGNEFYRTDITVSNASTSTVSALLYRAGDCFLQNSDVGFGFVDPAHNAPACTQNANNSPPGQVEQFSPLTAPIHQVEGNFSDVWTDIANQTDLPDTCECTTADDNGAGINWDLSLAPGGSATFSMLTNFSSSGQLVGAPTVVTGPPSGVSGSAATLSGSVNPNGGLVSDCHFDWGTTTAYGNVAPCVPSPGSGAGAVGVSASLSGLAASTAYHFRVVATNPSGTSAGGDQSFTTLSPAPPSVSSSLPVVQGSSGAAFAGVVDPEGLVTTAHFEYGLDPKYSGGGAVVYDQVTSGQVVGSDFGGHGVSAVVSGLVPNALYHVRLVAVNSAGTVTAPDQTFVTGRDPAPVVPAIAKTANLVPVSGLVFVKAPRGSRLSAARVAAVGGGVVKGQGFVPLTEARQVPIGSEIDARRGTLEVVVASGHARRTQQARLAGGVFSSSQARSGPRKGLTTFGLLEGAFAGAPSYRRCGKAVRAVVGSSAVARAARLSSSVLQTLRASDRRGRFRTRGRYSAATVRGTIWDTVDRCDGTLTVVKRGSVGVLDFARRRTVTVRAGHRYLAKAFQRRRKH